MACFVKAVVSLKHKDTDQLQQELMESPDLQRFLQENDGMFKERDLAALLDQFLEKKQITKAELAKRAGMSEVYLYQLYTGRRFPSRSRMLSLCLGASATLEETQGILRQCGFATLYPANRRDAIIIYGITHGQDLFRINDTLFAENEETLY